MKIYYTIICLIILILGLINIDYNNFQNSENFNVYIITIASVILWIILMYIKPIKSKARVVTSTLTIVTILYGLWNLVAIIINPTELSGYVLVVSSILIIIQMNIINKQRSKKENN